jgi:hypothetical protein
MRAYEWKSALILALLVMILMRLVWMDLRSYVVVYAPQNRFAFETSERSGVCARSFGMRQRITSYKGERLLPRPGWADAWSYQTMLELSCRGGSFSESGFIRYNQGLLIATLLGCALLARILARSWIVSAIVAVALLSRGRLIAANGHIAAEHLIMLGIAWWGVSLAHWVRSGSHWALSLHVLALLWLLPLEPSFAFLSLALPLGLVLLKRSGQLARWDQHILSGHEAAHLPFRRFWPWRELVQRDRFQTRIGDGGGLFQPWAGGVVRLLQDDGIRRRYQRVSVVGLGVVGLGLLVLLLFEKFSWPLRPGHWSLREVRLWLVTWIQPLDRDLLLCILLMLISLGLRSPWLQGLSSVLALTLGALLLQFFGSLMLDALYLPWESSRFWLGPRLLLWWEPLLLTLGVLSFYQTLLHILPQLGARWYGSAEEQKTPEIN